MSRVLSGLALALLFVFPVEGIRAQSKVSGFAGSWILDKEQRRDKNVPRKLKDYKMLVGEVVSESGNLLDVKSQVDGPVEIEVDRSQAANLPSIVANPRTSSTSPTGASATTAGAVAEEKKTYGGTLALFFTPNEVSYNLDGKEVKVDIKQDGRVNGVARIKAKLDKSGKTLQFTTIRRTKTPQGEVEITTREWWKLSDDGNSLKLQRTVDMPNARDEITLSLTKVKLAG